MRRIYLIRHCKPIIPNDGSICIGVTDLPLSESGKVCAQKLKEFFSQLEFNDIYSSTLSRAKETAEIIAGVKQDVFYENRFNEIDMGIWDGMSFDEIKEKYPEQHEERGKDLEKYIVQGGESFSMCQKRAFLALNSIVNNTKGNIVIVSHAGINRVLISWLLERNLNNFFSIPQPYGCINILTESSGNYCVEKIGLTLEEIEKGRGA
ncbi:MAG: histidine phosphatase family protein [Eubacteriaceae bacterium]|nr:histidine phosphatase family protein [Eubacteriaceae bacterium]